jgi:hypothetical protein
VSVKGSYELSLTCDEKVDGERCKKNYTILDETRGQAKDAARQAGWMLLHDDKAICPEHTRARRGDA